MWYCRDIQYTTLEYFMTSPNILTFKKPAEPYNWESRFPLGNGRLGVMLKGDPFSEGLQLNEEHIWSGGPMDRANPSTAKELPEVRRLMKEGRINEAQEMAYRVMAGSTVNMRAYQNAGDFNIDFFTKKNWGVTGPMQGHTGDSYSNYKFTLDMSRACATVSYTDDEDTTFTRTTFVSAADDRQFHICMLQNTVSVAFQITRTLAAAHHQTAKRS